MIQYKDTINISFIKGKTGAVKNSGQTEPSSRSLVIFLDTKKRRTFVILMLSLPVFFNENAHPDEVTIGRLHEKIKSAKTKDLGGLITKNIFKLSRELVEVGIPPEDKDLVEENEVLCIAIDGISCINIVLNKRNTNREHLLRRMKHILDNS